MSISTLHDCNTSTLSLRLHSTPSSIEYPHRHSSGRGMLLADLRTGRVGKHLTNRSTIIARDAFLLFWTSICGVYISIKEKYLFSPFFALFSLIFTFSDFFLASISYVLNLYKLMRFLQWVDARFWLVGKSAKIS